MGAADIILGVVLNRLPGFFTRLSLSLTSVAVLILFLEGLCQLTGYDFGAYEAWNATLIYYRQLTVLVSEVFFRRPENAKWTGKVLNARYGEYREEDPLMISYDAKGIRNPPELTDWEIAFIGDSFTELGYLAQD